MLHIPDMRVSVCQTPNCHLQNICMHPSTVQCLQLSGNTCMTIASTCAQESKKRTTTSVQASGLLTRTWRSSAANRSARETVAAGRDVNVCTYDDCDGDGDGDDND